MQDKRSGLFIVRYWALPAGERRLELEHVPSGARHRCAMLAEAEAWLVARVRASPGDPAPSAPAGAAPSEPEPQP